MASEGAALMATAAVVVNVRACGGVSELLRVRGLTVQGLQCDSVLQRCGDTVDVHFTQLSLQRFTVCCTDHSTHNYSSSAQV